MIITGIDKRGTETYQKRTKRQKEMDNQSLLKKRRKTEHDHLFVLDLEKFLEISEDECKQRDPYDEVYECTYSTQSISDQNRHPLPKLSRMCDRYGISDRAGASIANAALQDFGILSKENLRIVIDHSKLRREREKWGK